MNGLRIAPVDGDAMVRDWRHVHNAVIPTHLLSLDDVQERAGRHRLAVGYLGETLVGCSTMRPPTPEEPVATVIARVLPAHRGQGFGQALYARALEQARGTGAEVVETVVLASNVSGLRFARARGFTEVEEYLLPGETVPWWTLRLG